MKIRVLKIEKWGELIRDKRERKGREEERENIGLVYFFLHFLEREIMEMYFIIINFYI